MKRTLEEFRNRCPGILGSLVLNNNKELVDQELPSFLEVNIGEIVGQLADIYEAMKPVLGGKLPIKRPDTHDLILRYDSITIYCRVVREGLLILLLEPEANRIKVRAMSNLLIIKLESLLSQERKGD